MKVQCPYCGSDFLVELPPEEWFTVRETRLDDDSEAIVEAKVILCRWPHLCLDCYSETYEGDDEPIYIGDKQ